MLGNPEGSLSNPTVDGRNPAPPKKPWNHDSLVNANRRSGLSWFPSSGFRPSTVWNPQEPERGSQPTPLKDSVKYGVPRVGDITPEYSEAQFTFCRVGFKGS